MIIYKINVIDELNKHGYTNSILRDNNFLSQATLTNLRRGGNITIATLNILCLLLDCQPGDIIEISASEEEKKKYRKKCLEENELLKYISHSKLLVNMITYMRITDIKLLKSQRKHTEYHYKKYAEVEKFYETYNRLKKPIIVDRNLKLLGGFISLMFAKEHGIGTVPVIILENVEIIK